MVLKQWGMANARDAIPLSHPLKTKTGLAP